MKVETEVNNFIIQNMKEKIKTSSSTEKTRSDELKEELSNCANEMLEISSIIKNLKMDLMNFQRERENCRRKLVNNISSLSKFELSTDEEDLRIKYISNKESEEKCKHSIQTYQSIFDEISKNKTELFKELSSLSTDISTPDLEVVQWYESNVEFRNDFDILADILFLLKDHIADFEIEVKDYVNFRGFQKLEKPIVQKLILINHNGDKLTLQPYFDSAYLDDEDYYSFCHLKHYEHEVIYNFFKNIEVFDIYFEKNCIYQEETKVITDFFIKNPKPKNDKERFIHFGTWSKIQDESDLLKNNQERFRLQFGFSEFPVK